MIIVDNKVTSDYSNIFREYNWPHKPIRIFTYLVDSGISKESELKNIACNNKGDNIHGLIETITNGRGFYFIFYQRINCCRIL